MAKILSVHVYEPAPGASEEAYENLMLATARELQSFVAEGWRSYVVKGDRGANKGKYGIIHEFDSVEARNRYWPVEDGGATEETQRIFFDWIDRGLTEQWEALVDEGRGLDYSDFAVVDR